MARGRTTHGQLDQYTGIGVALGGGELVPDGT